jgi:hypothetical protein
MEGLDSIARRYGVLPSQVLAVKDEFVALSIDIWAHNWGVQAEEIAMRKAQERARRGRRGR